MKTSSGFIGMFALVGYLLSFVSYLMFVPEALQHFPIILGMTVVASGYMILFVREIYKIYIKHEETAKHAKPDEKRAMMKNVKVMHVVGFALLAIFFFMIHLYPGVTFRIRFYDVFAAIGYFVAFFTEFGYIPLWIAYIPLVIYYIFAGSVKVFEDGWPEKLQLVARLMLAVYYGTYLI